MPLTIVLPARISFGSVVINATARLSPKVNSR